MKLDGAGRLLDGCAERQVASFETLCNAETVPLGTRFVARDILGRAGCAMGRIDVDVLPRIRWYEYQWV